MEQESLVVVCGSDLSFPNAEAADLLSRFLFQLNSSVNGRPINASTSCVKALCFVPAPYGSEALIQSLSNHACVHHTLPCPSIPIPRGADFIGRHVSQVEGDVHLPLPDAYRTFQMQQAIRSQQRAGEPLMLHSHTPGMIGYHVRREALKRRYRSKPIPFVATHWTRYQPFVETRVVEIVDALRSNQSLTFNEFFTHGGLLERLIPALHEDQKYAPALNACSTTSGCW